MAEYIVDTQNEDPAELSGDFEVDEDGKTVGFGTSGQADTEFVFPSSYPWLLAEIYDVEDISGDVGYTLLKTNTRDISSFLTFVRSKGIAAYTVFKIVVTHYKTGGVADVYRGDENTALSLSSLDTNIRYSPSESSWKISNTLTAPLAETMPTDYEAYWPLQDNGEDESENSHDLTVDGVVFNGSYAAFNDAEVDNLERIDTSADLTGAAITIGVRVYATNTTADTIFSKYEEADPFQGYGFMLGSTSGGVWSGDETENAGWLTTTTIKKEAETWVHYTLVFSGTTCKVYEDGVYQDTITDTIELAGTGEGVFRMGYSSGGGGHFGGRLSHFVIYQYELTSSEIQAVANVANNIELLYGPEKVPYPYFQNDTGWTLTTGVSIDTSTEKMTIAGASGQNYIDLGTVDRKTVRIWFTVSEVTTMGVMAISIGGYEAVYIKILVPGDYHLDYRSQNTSQNGRLYFSNYDNVECKISFLSVKPLISGEQLGSNICPNGVFVDATGWSLGTGTTISGDKLNFDTTSSDSYSEIDYTGDALLRYDIYRIDFDVSNWTAGYIAFRISGSTVAIGVDDWGNDSYHDYVSIQHDTPIIEIKASGTNPSMSVDNLTVRKVLSAPATIMRDLTNFYLLNSVDLVTDSAGTLDGTASNMTYTPDYAIFNGTSSEVEILENTFEFSEATISFNFRLDNVSQWHALLSKIDSISNVECGFYIENKYMALYQERVSNNYYTDSNTTLMTDTWYHMVFSIDSNSKASIYIDGNLDIVTDPPSTPTLTTLPVNLGHDDEYDFWLEGNMSKVRTYDVAVDADFAEAIYLKDRMLIDLTENLTNFYPLDSESLATDTVGSLDGSASNITYASDYASFNGTTSKIEILEDTYVMRDTTVSFNVRTNSIATQQGVFSKLDDANDKEIRFTYEDSAFMTDQETGGVSYYNDMVVTPEESTWYHIVISFDADANASVYIDGAFDTVSSVATPPTTQTLPVYLGHTEYYSSYLDGDMSKVRVYDKPVNAAFAKAIYLEDGAPIDITADLLAHWTLASDATDETGNYDGTETNMTYTDGVGGTFVNGVETHTYIRSSPVPTGTGDFSVTGWVKNSGGGEGSGDGWIVSTRSDGDDYNEWSVYFYDAPGSMKFSIADNGGANPLTLIFEDIPKSAHDDYFHFCVVVKGETGTVYTNNVQNDIGTYIGTRAYSSTNTTIGTGGWEDGHDSLDFDGNISNIRIYDVALTAEQRGEIYLKDNPFNENLIHYYPLNSTDSVRDVKGGLHGTAVDVTYSSTYATFNGSTSELEVLRLPNAALLDTQNKTYCLWFYIVDVSINCELMTKFANDENRFVHCEFYSSHLYTASTYDDDNGYFQAIVTPVDATWYHMVYSMDDTGAFTVYINGSYVNNDGSTGTYTNAEAPFNIGGLPGANRSIDGRLAEFRVYKGTKDADFASALFEKDKETYGY